MTRSAIERFRLKGRERKKTPEGVIPLRRFGRFYFSARGIAVILSFAQP